MDVNSGQPSTSSKVAFATPIFDSKSGTYDNPPSFTEWKIFKWRDLWAWRRTKDESDIPSDSATLDAELPIEQPVWADNSGTQTLRMTWIGHATVVVQMDGFVFLTDPVWSERCSPIPLTGPKRYRDPPCQISELPDLDFVVISHNHYDHLDSATVQKLEGRFANSNLKWFVPKGLKSFFSKSSHVQEMTWGDSVSVTQKDGRKCQLVCVPAQHWSKRGLFDDRKTLWCGWLVVGEKHKFYFAGDTGDCSEEFVKIGEQFGPIDLAAIPIGAYAPRWFMGPQHISPVEAVKIHKSVNAKTSIGIHWGTFHMGSTEFYLEPRNLLYEEVKKQGLTANSFITINHGHTWVPEENV